MKHLKLFLALTGVLSAAGLVQADEGNVTLYGQIRLSVDQTDAGDDGVTRVSSGESRLGVKGSETLGNGLKAVFQIETNLNLDDGSGSTGTLFSNGRDSYGGLAGKFGTVALGIINTPYRTSTDSLDVFDNSMADYNAIVGEVGNNTAPGGARTEFNRREPDTLNYWSPKFENTLKDFAFKAQIRQDEVGGIDQNRYSVSGVYDNGPWFASLAFELHNREATALINKVAVPSFDTEGFKAGLAYRFNGNNTRLGVLYENLSQESSGIFDRDAWYVSASHKIGINVLKFAYGHAGENDAVDDSGADFLVLGGSHNLSKRSELYALYARTENDSKGRYGLGASTSGAVAAAEPGAELDSFSVGLIHKF